MKRVAVIGAGAMGRNHVRIYRELEAHGAIQLAGVAEPIENRRRELAALFRVPVYADYRQLLAEASPNGVSVVVPTQHHHEVVSAALVSGCHVLVEKPIASNISQAEDLIRAADAAQRLLMVGHTERYNPAIAELKRQLLEGRLGRVFQIHARRLGPFPARVRDVGVVIDLATHDLDIMRFLTGAEITRVYAETRKQLNTENEDLLNGIVRFSDETLGLLEINWLTPTKIRELYVTGERGMYRADYLTQDLYFYENADVKALNWDALSVTRGVSEGAMTRFAVQKSEPLRVELETFVGAMDGSRDNIVSATDGTAALRLALALIESGQAHRSVELEL